MSFDPALHHRRSIRLRGHDYAGGGVYFVTICAHREFIDFAKGNPFGAVREGATCVSPVRGIIAEEWRRGGEIRDDVFPGEFVVMPDHFHGLIRIQKGQSELGHVIGAFKAAASRRIRGTGAALRAPVAHTAAPSGCLFRRLAFAERARDIGLAAEKRPAGNCLPGLGN